MVQLKQDTPDFSFDLGQSAIFGLGIIAQRTPNGQFAHLGDTIQVINSIVNKLKTLPADHESGRMLGDNVISTLNKIVSFQFDGGNLVTPDMVNLLLDSIPLTTDFEEAQPVHELFFKQLLAKNATLLAYPDKVKAVLNKIQEFASSHTEKEEDILGDEGRALFQQVIAQI